MKSTRVFSKYVKAVSLREQKTEIYRIYIAESLRLQGEGKVIGVKYFDLIHPKKYKDPVAIIDDVVKKAGLILEDDA